MSDAPLSSDGSSSSGRASKSLSIDEQFDLLSNARRRHILRYLKERPLASIPRHTIVDHLVAEGCGERKNVDIALEHIHLPKLTSAGVITYDEQERRIQYRGHDGLERLLEYVRAEE